MELGAETSFDLLFSGLETIYQPLSVLVGILLQPSKIIADGAPDFCVSAGKSGGHLLRVFGGVDISMDLDLDLRGKVSH